MLTLAIVEGYAGYSLLDDLLSGMGLAIGNATALSIPVVGGDVASLDLGRSVPGAPTPSSHGSSSPTSSSCRRLIAAPDRRSTSR